MTVFTIILIFAAVLLAAYAIWRGLRKAEVIGPEHERPIQGKANVIAARLENLAGSLETQAQELRELAEEAKGKKPNGTKKPTA